MTIRNPGKTPAERPEGTSEKVLRAKYLDWCSAQVADELLALTPDEIFELSERATQTDAQVGGRSFHLVPGQDMSEYRRMVAAVTEVLTQQMSLPTFEEWQEMYRANPAAIEDRLLGLWRETS